jgi:hypothetical protein
MFLIIAIISFSIREKFIKLGRKRPEHAITIPHGVTIVKEVPEEAEDKEKSEWHPIKIPDKNSWQDEEERRVSENTMSTKGFATDGAPLPELYQKINIWEKGKNPP